MSTILAHRERLKRTITKTSMSTFLISPPGRTHLGECHVAQDERREKAVPVSAEPEEAGEVTYLAGPLVPGVIFLFLNLSCRTT